MGFFVQFFGTILIVIAIIHWFIDDIYLEPLKQEKIRLEKIQKDNNYHEIKESKEFSEYKFFEGVILHGYVVNFCYLSESGDFYFYPDNIRFKIKDIISLSVIVDGSVSDGLKGAVTGSLLLGGVGALAGYLATNTNSIKQIGLRFNLDNFNQSNYSFMFFDNSVKLKVDHESVVSAKKRLQDYLSSLLIVDKRLNDSALFGKNLNQEEFLGHQ
jgi:hypothetical protein